jgi:hypothetical protein
LLKSFGLFMAVASLLVGCVSIGNPTAAPTLAPSFGITTPAPATPTRAPATPTAVPPTAQPTATPTAEPTASPTDEPTLAPTVEPTPDGGNVNGDLILFDDFVDPASGWQTGTSGNLSVAYQDGSLHFAVGDPGQGLWSRRGLNVEHGVLLGAGFFTASTGGAIGMLCVAPAGELYGALLTSTNRVVFFSIIAGTTNVLEGHDIDIGMTPGATEGFGLECAGTSTGNFRMVAVLQGSGVLATYENTEGPELFTDMALYSEALDEAVEVDVSQAAVYAVPGSAEGMSPEAEELLTHVPSDWQQTCIETPASDVADAVVSCFLQTEGTGAELAVFQQYPTAEEMDATYQNTVDIFGVESEGSCQSGPHETTWNVDDVVGGKLLCAPQGVGIRFDWTDDDLLILSTLFDLEGDYQNTYNLWTEAGPV